MNTKFPLNHFLNLDHLKQANSVESTPAPKKEEIAPKNTISDSNDLALFNKEIHHLLAERMDPSKYQAFFAENFTLCNLNQSSIEFVVSTEFIRNIIETHYLNDIKNVLSDILGKNYAIIISVMGKTVRVADNFQSKTKEVKTNTFVVTEIEPNQQDTKSIIESKGLEFQQSQKKLYGFIDQNKTFDNFVSGPFNQMAYAASVGVAKEPGKAYPILYIHGGSGLGKTHLLHAIANHILQTKPQLRVCVISTTNFMLEMAEAFKNNDINNFRKRYAEQIDVLLIDDVHELKQKTGTQNEIFYIFNELNQRGKQLVFTSDKIPREIEGIEERIKTRLSSAILMDIQQPDFESRIAILKSKAIEKDLFLSDDVVNLIAKCVKTNIRELEGSLVQLGVYSQLMKVDMDLELTKKVLRLDDQIEQQKHITSETITKVVANHFNIPLGDIRGQSRVKEISHARHLAIYLIHTHLKLPLKEIGSYFQNRDHTTILHAINKVKDLIKVSPSVSTELTQIESKF